MSLGYRIYPYLTTVMSTLLNIRTNRIEMPKPTSLPAELTDDIIIWIPTSYPHPLRHCPTLLSCCLVCHSWLPANRHQLLQDLYFETSKHYDLFLVARAVPGVRECITQAEEHSLAMYAFPKSRIFSYTFAGHLPNLNSLSLVQAGLTTYFTYHPRTVLALCLFSFIRNCISTTPSSQRFDAPSHPSPL